MALAINERGVMRSEMKSPARSKGLVIQSSGAAAMLQAGNPANPNVPDKASNNIYPLGQNNTNDCRPDVKTDDLITDPEVCMRAAGKTNACVEAWPGEINFEVPESAWDNHPRGCFAWPCMKEDSTCRSGMCYYYNKRDAEGDEDNNGVEGQPVCYSAMYLNGSTLTGTPPTENHGCPAAFEPILDIDQCRAYAQTNAYCTETDNFEVGISGGFNATRQHDFPEGCFLSTDPKVPEAQRCIYFNNMQFIGGHDPKTPHGIPACNSTTDGHWWPDLDSSLAQGDDKTDNKGDDEEDEDDGVF
jgi:hypothetical protein